MHIKLQIQTADFIGAISAVSTTVTSVVVVNAFTTSTPELIRVRAG